MDAIITYNRKIPIYKYALGFAAIGVGLLGLFNLVIFSIVPLLFGCMMLKTEGSEIDLESKTFRETNSILGIKIGKWRPLPTIDYILVFATNENITVRALSAETTNAFPIIDLNLFYDNNKKITVYQTKSKADAFDVASHISEALLIDILDATEKGESKWLEKSKVV